MPRIAPTGTGTISISILTLSPRQLLPFQVFAHNELSHIGVLIKPPICFQTVQQAPALLHNLTTLAAQALLGALAELAVGVQVGAVEGQEAKVVEEAKEVAVVVVMKQQMVVAEGACNLSP